MWFKIWVTKWINNMNTYITFFYILKVLYIHNEQKWEKLRCFDKELSRVGLLVLFWLQEDRLISWEDSASPCPSTFSFLTVWTHSSFHCTWSGLSLPSSTQRTLNVFWIWPLVIGHLLVTTALPPFVWVSVGFLLTQFPYLHMPFMLQGSNHSSTGDKANTTPQT